MLVNLSIEWIDTGAQSVSTNITTSNLSTGHTPSITPAGVTILLPGLSINPHHIVIFIITSIRRVISTFVRIPSSPISSLSDTRLGVEGTVVGVSITMVGNTHTVVFKVASLLTSSKVLLSSKPSVITSIAVAGAVYGTKKRCRRFGLEAGGSTVRVLTSPGVTIAIHRGSTPGSTISRVIGGALLERVALVRERKLTGLVVYCTAGSVTERRRQTGHG